MRVPNEASSPPRRPWAIAVAILLAVPLTAGVVQAAIPDKTGKITVCYKPYTGQMRLVDTESVHDCASDEKPLSWNEHGFTGLDIVANREPVFNPFFGLSFNSDDSKTVDADCAAGKRVVGTGVEIDHPKGAAPGTVTIESIRPKDPDTVEARASEIGTGTPDGWALRVIAVCVDAP